MPTVCEDPGHGGYDPGACGNDLEEKDVTLDIALRLRPLLEFNGISVIMTRDGDYAPGHLENALNAELTERSNIANNAKVDLLVSIHVNSGGGEGQEELVYATGGRAETAANKLLPYLVAAGNWSNRGVKSQNVSVLRKTNMPAILTENGFIDNAADAAKLKDPSFRQALAVAHAKGICDYFGITYKEKGGDFMPDVSVVYFTSADYSVALVYANQNSGCAMYCRNGGPGVHADALKAKKIYNIGGPELKVPGEVWLSGDDAKATLKKAAAAL